jgi:DNA-binding CsgD family transcriptional regulator
MRTRIVGREVELRALRGFVAAAGVGPGGLVLEGGAGFGKSTLWLAAVEEAREAGYRVLAARPAEAERGLPHAGLADLLEPVLGEVWPVLPGPRRHALEVALLLAEPDERADPRTLPVAVRSALLALAGDAPVLLAVDDVQWLDPSSQAALAFAVRRLEEEPVRVLLARRVEEGVEPPELERALDPEPTARVSVGPLSVGAIQRLLQERLGRAFPRPVLVRVHETSGGNPFHALELARALPPDLDPTRPLPVPDTLEGLVRERLAALPQETWEALSLLAAAGRPHVSLLRRAGVTERALEPAERAHVIVRDNGVIRFAHPLLGAVVERQQSDRDRRSVHVRLADLVDDPLARARHLALASEEADEDIAAELEQAAATAGARGAALAAAELAEHALRFVPSADDQEVHRLTISAARRNLAAGDSARSSRLARDLLARTDLGQRRAELLLLLADVECGGGGGYLRAGSDHDAERAYDLYIEALDEVEDPALRARIHERVAAFSGLFTKGPRVAEDHARVSLALAEALGDEAAAARALGTLAAARYSAGEADAAELVERACERARATDDLEALGSATVNRHRFLIDTGQFEAGRELLEALERDWRRRRQLLEAWFFFSRTMLEFYAGDFRVGSEYASRSREIALDFGRDEPEWRWQAAGIAAHRGELEEAAAIAERGLTMNRPMSEGVLGCVRLWSADAQAAIEHFTTAERSRSEFGVREPHLFWWRADYCDALLELGRVDEAAALLDAWNAEAARLGRERVLAKIERCRGLIAAARGETGEALVLLEHAAERHEALGDRYDRGRALLALGRVRRRLRQKRAAREAIEEALAEFEACGSELFAGKARAELGSIGGRRREEGLTAAEQRVAELVAAGKTNREAAAALFLAERTVASHLSHVYAKLGVRSRTELARALAAVS